MSEYLPMGFTDTQKLRARRKADWRCCICGRFGVDIHHIEPQSEGGPDSDDNAAPLCVGCHDERGHDPRYRKQITQKRDDWYAEVARRQLTRSDEDALEGLTEFLLSVARQEPGVTRSELREAPTEVATDPASEVRNESTAEPGAELAQAWLQESAADCIPCHRCQFPVHLDQRRCERCGATQVD